jgi:membrane dipeptidase
MPSTWFDAHLDLAYLAVNGRDLNAALDVRAGPHPPASVTLPALREGGVRFILATVFTEADGTGPESYPAGDVERAAAAGRAQLEVYLTWRDRGLAALDLRRVFRRDKGVGRVRGGLGVAEVVPLAPEQVVAGLPRSPWMHVGILVECADPIRSPEELDWWIDRGVAAIGLTWARGSRYAAGNSEPSCSSGVGLTPLGREMVAAMDHRGVVHDASHLSWRAMDELFTATAAPVIASHSNSSALLTRGAEASAIRSNQRHLRDEHVREIGRRGGVIGLNLVRNFIRSGLNRDDPADRPTIDEAVAHVDHMAEVMGHRRGVGLGSDLDGGITAHDLPAGIHAPRDFEKLAAALSARGWSDEEAEDFRWRNWARFWMSR